MPTASSASSAIAIVRADLLAQAGDHEEREVDAEREREDGRGVRHEDAQPSAMAQQEQAGEGHDQDDGGEQERQGGGDCGHERDQQHRERERERDLLRSPQVFARDRREAAGHDDGAEQRHAQRGGRAALERRAVGLDLLLGLRRFGRDMEGDEHHLLAVVAVSGHDAGARGFDGQHARNVAQGTSDRLDAGPFHEVGVRSASADDGDQRRAALAGNLAAQRVHCALGVRA
jgi:hypothetical protein